VHRHPALATLKGLVTIRPHADSVASLTEQVQITETLYQGASSNECKKLKNFKIGIQDDLLTARVRVPETIMEGAENA